MSFAQSANSDGDRDSGEFEHGTDLASANTEPSPQRPAPTLVDPILVERQEAGLADDHGADAADSDDVREDTDVAEAEGDAGVDDEASQPESSGLDEVGVIFEVDADAQASEAADTPEGEPDAAGSDGVDAAAADEDAADADGSDDEVDAEDADADDEAATEAEAATDDEADPNDAEDADASDETASDDDAEATEQTGEDRVDEDDESRADASDGNVPDEAEAHDDVPEDTEPMSDPADADATAPMAVASPAVASTASDADDDADAPAPDDAAATTTDDQDDTGRSDEPVARGHERDLAFGAATAAGLSTMTPVARVTEAPHRELGDAVLRVEGLSKQFGSEFAVQDLSFDVRKGSFFGIVGPNGAGKTTTLSMVTGMLRPTAGSASVLGVDVWRASAEARAHIGILPDRLRLFDQLTGAQLLYYTGVLRGLPADEARARTASLLDAFEIGTSADRLVVDYSAGMTKKIALASSLIHSPELLVLDEPFESIDPVSAGQLTDILFEYVRRGGTVMLSSHSMDLVQRVCDHVAVIVRGEILAQGTVSDVRGDVTLEERFRDIVRGPRQTEGLDWLGISFS